MPYTEMLAYHVRQHAPGEHPQLIGAFLLKADAVRFMRLLRRELPHRDGGVKFRCRYIGIGEDK